MARKTPEGWETGKLKKSQESSTLNFATQSGPMLVKNNVINSQFIFNSSNFNIRNGVGISTKWKRKLVVLVISDTKVNFYESERNERVFILRSD